MRFIITLTAFFIVIILERTAVPQLFGVFLPLSFWFLVTALFYLKENQGLWFGMAAGALFSWTGASPMVWPMLLFPIAAALFFWIRRIFGKDEIVGYITSSAAAVFSFQLLEFPVSSLFDANATAAGVITYSDFLVNLVFVALLAAVIFAAENRRSSDRIMHI